MNIWKILNIEETKDIAIIKKAYAKLAKEYNPEDHPAEFLQIRRAYDQAVKFANKETDFSREITSTDIVEDIAITREEAPGWNFIIEEESDCKLYVDCAAINDFKALYFSQNRKNKDLWIQYFSSDNFLDVFKEKGFTKALLNEIENTEEKFKPNREFLTILQLVYGLASQNIDDQVAYIGKDYDVFDGINHIVTIANKGKALQHARGNELAILVGYKDYARLVHLTKSGVWTDEVSFSLGKVLDRYVSAYIYDKVPQNINPHATDFLPRHISSLNLLTHFFKTAKLPKGAFVILWDKLSLNDVKMGRNKILYGKLREIACGLYPDLENGEKEDFAGFHSALSLYAQRAFKRKGMNFAEEKEDADAFFEKEDLKKALRNQIFVENNILKPWFTKEKSSYFLEKLIDFCKTNQDVFHKDKIIENAEFILKNRTMLRYLEEDAHSEILPDSLTVSNRAFFRYLLNSAFHHAYSHKKSVSLSSYLVDIFPVSLEWNKAFLQFNETTETFDQPRGASIDFNGNTLAITFHLHYVEYTWNDKPVYAPFVHYNKIAGIDNDTLFWLILPVIFAHIDNAKTVYHEILSRLARLSFLEDVSISFIADCLTDSICKNYDDTFYPALLKLFAEDTKTLYGCDIYVDEGVLVTYMKNTKVSYLTMKEDEFPQGNIGAAIDRGKRLLAEYTESFTLDKLTVERLPDFVFVKVRDEASKTYEELDVTFAIIQELFGLYAQNKVERLELSWGYRSLVLIKAKSFGCFCFDHGRAYRYTLLSNPEIYRTVHKDVQYVPFLFGKIPNYCEHANCLIIFKHLNKIINEISDLSEEIPDSHDIWSQEVYYNRKQWYDLDKRLLGGFPDSRISSYLYGKFELTNYPSQNDFPSQMISKDLENNEKTIAINGAARFLVQEMLMRFMYKKLNKLILTWSIKRYGELENLEISYHAHIILVQDHDTFMMMYCNDQIENMYYLVYDVIAYRDSEGKEIPKVEFNHTLQHAYLIHHDLKRIRNFLDLLLPNIAEPHAILDLCGEFYFGFASSKTEPYDTCKAEYFSM